jgi:hypothetical protein
MTEQLTFDFAVLADPTPEWAAACWYCHPDELGQYDEARHLAGHLPKTCAVCGDTSPNALLFGQSHSVTLGPSWRSGWLLCTSLWLRLNHLTYALRNSETPSPRDLTVLDLGWTFAPDGERFAPEGWPSSDLAVRCEPMERGA